mgnify:FL=1|tara:strand:- start:995 stop:1801 length:807 start_codon:yes stop_codon:yes gene_type:complete
MFDENLENIVNQFENRIMSVRDGDEIESVAENYESLNHPQIGYRVGEKFLIVDWKEDALPYLIKSASFGLDPDNFYLGTGYGDSIAQSMWYILKKYDFKSEFEPYEYKIYCSAFMILSLMINAMGNDAYNSLKTRAMMIDNLNKSCVKKMLSKYYYDGEDLCTEILSFMDYHRASIGFLNVQEIQNAQNCRNWAQENLDKMLSLPQYKAMSGMPEQTIQKMSQENQIHLLNNMLQDYKDGAFKLSKSELENAISNYRIKPRSGFGSWI